MALGGLFGTCE